MRIKAPLVNKNLTALRILTIGARRQGLDERNPYIILHQRKILHRVKKRTLHQIKMPPKKETVNKDEFNALKTEIERNSQILVNRLFQKIKDNEEKYFRKVEELEGELNEIKLNYNNLSKKQRQNKYT